MTLYPGDAVIVRPLIGKPRRARVVERAAVCVGFDIDLRKVVPVHYSNGEHGCPPREWVTPVNKAGGA